VGRSVIIGNPTCPPRLVVLSPPEQVARLNGEKWQLVLKPITYIMPYVRDKHEGGYYENMLHC